MRVSLCVAVTLVAGLGVTAPIPAQSRDLFEAIPAGVADLTARQGEIVAELRRRAPTSVLSLVRAALNLADQERVRLNLRPSLSFEVRQVGLVRRTVDDYSWRGEIDEPRGQATFVVRQGNLSGTIRAGIEVYEIRPIGGGVHVIVERDVARYPTDHPPGSQAEADARPSSTPRIDARDGDRFTVLVGYTTAVNAALLDVDGLIQLAVDETNESYLRSDVDLDLALVATQLFDYVESGSFDTDLDRLETPDDGTMDGVHQLRDDNDADVVVLLIDNDDYCGLASEVPAGAATAFAVVHYDCATGYFSFAHELGHLHGALHNPEADSSDEPFEYGHGYYYEPGAWRTIMSYNCPSGCTRLANWSSPDVSRGDWYFSAGASSAWQRINTSRARANEVRFGNFDAKGGDDVFASWGGRWRVSYGGTGKWQVINTSTATVDQVRLADFDADGRADVFATWGGRWRVSYGGTGSWQVINTSTATVDQVKLADFNADGKADVFATWGGKWRVSYSGTGNWQVINTSGFALPGIAVADLDGDKKADVFRGTGGRAMGSAETHDNARVLRETAATVMAFR